MSKGSKREHKRILREIVQLRKHRRRIVAAKKNTFAKGEPVMNGTARHGTTTGRFSSTECHVTCKMGTGNSTSLAELVNLIDKVIMASFKE